MSSLPVKLMACVIGLAVVAAAAPADAAKARKHKKVVKVAKVGKVYDRSKNDYPPGPVYFGNEYLGDDPDPNIRLQLLRDLGAHFGGND